MANEIKHNGFIYSKGTKAGFERMRRMGIPGASIKNENRMTDLLQKVYKKVMRDIMLQFKNALAFSGLKIKGEMLTHDSGEDDTFERLLAFFDDMSDETRKAEENVKMRSSMLNAMNIMENEPLAIEEDFMSNADFSTFENIFKDNQDDYLRKFSNDAGDKMKLLLGSFSLDKKKLYEENLDALRRLYLDNSIERVKGESDMLKARFLNRLNDYVIGKTDTLNITDVVEDLQKSCKTMARFFARDQMARFNKATTLMTFENAGVSKVKWVTSHDVRVRESHRRLDGKIFSIGALPPETDDFNCRCGLVPVEYID